jgi:DNA-binding beta-propeller fold protein YncE
MSMYRHISLIAVSLAVGSVGAHAKDPTYSVLKSIKVTDGGWDYATSDLRKDKVYWVRTDHTDVVDGKTGAVTVMKNTGNGHMAVVVPNTDIVVIPMRDPVKTNRIFDIVADKVVAEVPGGEAPDGAIYDPYSKHVFVINHNGSDATEIDPKTRTVVATIAIGGGKLEFPATDGAGRVFVNVQAAGEVAVIDTKTHKLVTKYKMDGCSEASGLNYAHKSKVLIAACGNGVAKVLDAATGKELASIPIGKGPDSVIYDPKNQMAFVPCGDDAVLEIIDVRNRDSIRKIQSLKTPPLARTGAVDRSGRVYLMAAEPDPSKPKGGGGRPAPKDGTFQVVVVGR